MSTEKKSANTLSIKSLAEVAVEASKYIERRKTGEEKSLKVGSKKVNTAIMGGIDWGRIITIAGASGSGKSILTRQWVKEMVELNPTEKFEVLSFQFEMLGIDELARDIVSKSSLNIRQIYSAENPLTDSQLSTINIILDELKKYPISVVDNIGTVRNILDTIIYFVSSNRLVEQNKGLVVTLDHSLLVKPEDNQGEKETIDALMHMFVALKKYLSSIGLKVIFIILSQLNRNIETNDRIINPRLHFPNKNDLFGASSVYYSSDYVMVIHRPAIIEGLGNWYGPARKNFPNGLPVYNPTNPDQPMIYLHIIKERFGMNKVIPMVDELEKSRITEYDFNF